MRHVRLFEPVHLAEIRFRAGQPPLHHFVQDHWLRLASQPGPGGEAESTAYLDQLPLRSILRLAAGRVLRKVRG